MSLTYEKLEGNMAELTITVPAEDFKKATERAYNKNKGRFNVNGFRKGKVPKAIIEKLYGPAVFFDDAANDCINQTYGKELDSCDLEIVSNPEIDVKQIEEGKDFIYTAKVATKPPVELGDIASIEVEKENVEVTDEDLQNEIDRALKQNSKKVEVTDRAAAKDDEATINFEGFVDGVAFDGGKGESYPLVLGSGSFIPGFEDQVIGHSVDEEFDVNVTFPEQYQAEDLAGKDATFKVKILSIKENVLPTLDDEYVADTTDFDTVDEYKEDLKKKLTERKENAAKAAKQQKAIEKLVEASTMEIPEAMIQTQQQRMLDEFAQQLSYQGMQLNQYLSMTGQSRQDMLDQVKPEAEKRIKQSLVVEAVAKEQNFEVSDDEVNEELEKMAKQYNMEFEKIKDMVGENEKNSIREDLKMQKAADYIAANVKEAE